MRRTPLKRTSAPLRRSKPLRGRRRRTRSKADWDRWWSTFTGWCIVCGAQASDRHHVVYAQHVRSYGGDEWEPDNALDVCRDCHAAHHSRSRPIPLAALLRVNREFARGLLGEFADDYLGRRYRPVGASASGESDG